MVSVSESLKHDLYIRRCFQIARNGQGNTLTNPLVGAMLVFDGKIIGEGYHKAYGADHAEIEAFKSVKSIDQDKIARSTLYVSLEPCSIQGKTPPCVQAIIQHKIKTVYIGSLDPNPKINGNGVMQLREHGVKVFISGLQAESEKLNKIFFKNMTQGLPYIVLKFACTADYFIGNKENQVQISNPWSKILVHKKRHEVDAILIGTHTAIIDNPQLTNRFYFGKNPIRIVLDRHGRIPMSYHLFTDGMPTWISTENNTLPYPDQVMRVPFFSEISEFMRYLLKQGIGSILVEGGAQLLSSILNTDLWDEMWVTQSEAVLGSGIKAPAFNGFRSGTLDIGTDRLSVFLPI